jgi:radical SAM protein with 4Fe4S-binding SPASM domain
VRLKLLKGFDISVLYICDINNYIYLPNDSIINELDIDEEISEEEFLSFINLNFPEKLDKFIKILNSNKNYYSDGKTKVNEYTICIHPSRKCNLKCKYCFGNEDYLSSDEISLETAIKAINYIVLNYGANGSMYTVDLSGSGEPLLRIDLIKKLDEYCDRLRNKIGKQILIKFATNATLVSDEIADYLHNSKCIIYGVSIDGNQKQNMNRLYKSGKPIYNDLIKGIDKLNNDLLGLAVTITHKNEDVDEIYSHLYSLGVSAISMHFVRDYTDSDTSLYKIDIDNLLFHYNKLLNLIINNIKAGNNEYIMPLIRGDDYFGVLIKKAFFKGNIPKFRCPAGRSKFAVNQNGDLYACSVMNGNRDFYVGNIYDGIDKEKQATFMNSNIEMSEKCNDCWCKNICAGECMANSYLRSKTLYEPNDFLCDLKYQLIPKAITFIEYLRLNYEETYMMIKNFILSSVTFSHSDSATWAVLKFLKNKKCNVTFSEVSNSLSAMKIIECNSFEKGIHPQYVEKYLSNYDNNICAVYINNADSFEEVKQFPIIAYLNKVESPYHQYFFIEKMDKKFIYFKTVKYDTVKSIGIQEFLDNFSSVFIGDFYDLVKN